MLERVLNINRVLENLPAYRNLRASLPSTPDVLCHNHELREYFAEGIRLIYLPYTNYRINTFCFKNIEYDVLSAPFSGCIMALLYGINEERFFVCHVATPKCAKVYSNLISSGNYPCYRQFTPSAAFELDEIINKEYPTAIFGLITKSLDCYSIAMLSDNNAPGTYVVSKVKKYNTETGLFDEFSLGIRSNQPLKFAIALHAARREY